MNLPELPDNQRWNIKKFIDSSCKICLQEKRWYGWVTIEYGICFKREGAKGVEKEASKVLFRRDQLIRNANEIKFGPQ